MRVTPDSTAMAFVTEPKPVYDPDNLDPLDAEARQYDDNSEGIDWDEIIASTEQDFAAGKYMEFKSVDYATEEALLDAIHKWRESVLNGTAFQTTP